MSMDDLHTALTPAGPWTARAACRGVLDVFFGGRGANDQTRQAKAICAECPVRDECLEYALDNEERYGVWGGKSEKERCRMRNARRIQSGLSARGPRPGYRTAECGTVSGYQAHRRNGEVACRACLEAANAYKRDYKARLRASARDAALSTEKGTT